MVEAAYYDGRSAHRHDVMLSVVGDRLCIAGAGREERVSALQIPAALGHAPRLILFSDGARCEVEDHEGFAVLLQSMGRRPGVVAHLEARWSAAVVALLLTLGVIVAAYLWGLPYAADKAAARVPEQVLTRIDDQFLATFDGRLLHPSKLPGARRQALQSRLDVLRLPPGGRQPARLLFRSSPQIGANAFALPGGSVVVLDEIVALAANDEEILGVLAHEMGHVSERHALRQMLQASVVGLAMTWYVGDISNLLAAAPTVLLQTRYSRDFELRADAFAARMLALNHISPQRLADMLDKLERAHGQTGQSGQQDKIMDYLSTHPDTRARIRALREAH